MAYDEAAADRVRRAIAAHEGLSERKMFGGLCLMVGGNMFAGIIGDELMLRVGMERFEALLYHFGAEPREMEAELYLLDPGTYRYTLEPAEGGTESDSVGGKLDRRERSGRIGFRLPARRLCRLRVEPE